MSALRPTGNHTSDFLQLPQMILRKRGRILVVDDDQHIRELMKMMLCEEPYDVFEAENGEHALDVLSRQPIDLIFTDVMMPKMDGFELVRRVKSNLVTRLIPVVMVTALESRDAWLNGINCGADDFLTKPIDQLILVARARSLMNLKQFTDDLIHAQEAIYALARTVEVRDGYTHNHSERVNRWAITFARFLQLDHESLRAVDHASYLHDIGKIGVPDQILRKTGPLDVDEWDIMKQHPDVGADICAPLRLLEDAVPLIRHHQERWDGSGYPGGLSADNIPMGAQIIAVVDCWDALITDRPYRKGLSLEEAAHIIERETQDGKWNPFLVDHWLRGVGDMEWGR